MPRALGLRLGVLDRHGDVRGHRAEDLEVVVSGAPAAERLVDRQEAEDLRAGADEGGEEGVVGVPGVGVVAGLDLRHVGERAVRLPVEVAVAQEVGPVTLEAVLEQDVPVGPRAGDAEQHLARLVGAEHGHDLEVVPGPPAQVDHDRAVAEGARDRSRDRVKHGLQGGAGSRRARDVQQAT